MRRALWISSASVALISSGASAQTSVSAVPETPAASADADDQAEQREDGVGTIVVTAQRFGQDLQRTPVAVTALSSEQLTNRGIQDVGDLVNVVPNLAVGAQTASQGGNAVAFSIRGLSQQRDGNGTQPAVALYIDDFYYPNLAGNLLSALDVTGIEVLRGPQGTLFGRNTIGGAIRYQTRKPQQEFGGYVDGVLGSYERTDIVGALNVPVGERVAMRFTGAYLKRDGWQERVIDDLRNGGSEDSLLRGQLRVRPSDKLTLDLSYDRIHSKLSGFTIFVPTIGVTPGPRTPLTFGRNYNAFFDPDYTQAYASVSPRLAYGASPLSLSRTNSDNIHFVADAMITEGLQVKLLSGRVVVRDHYRNDADGSPLPVILATGDTRTGAWSHELQAIGAFGPVNFTVGAYYYDEEFRGNTGFINYGPTGALANSSLNLARRWSKSLSGYANLTYALTDRFTLTGGVRVGEDKAEASLNNGPKAERSWSQVLPMVRAQYQWTPDVMTYASVSKGFRAGGYNILPTGALIPFSPETVWTGEVGLRLQALDNRLRFNPTVFYTDYKDIVIQRIPTSGPAIPILENAGEGHIYGVEMEAQLVPTRGLNLNLAASYQQAAYDKVSTTFITTATPLSRLPEWKFSAGAGYRWLLTSGANINFNVDYSYTGSQWSADTDSNRLLLKGYHLVNARVAYQPEGGAWSLAAFVTNLTDTTYFNGGLNFIPNAGNITFNVGRPREFGIQARVNF